MLNRWTMVTGAALVAVSSAMAQDTATLKVGDKAPALSVEDWVKGNKVEKFESGKVYVVEFWATWCPPCRESIPHLTKLQKEFKDKHVTIIGVASSEKGKDAPANLKTVKDFVKGQGDKMHYTIAFDGDRSMSKSWMAPANQRGIPCAFLVGGDGKIAWIGNPLAPEGEIDSQIKKAVEANKRVGQGKTDGSTQVASNSGGHSDSHSSKSSESSSSSSSEKKSTSSSSSSDDQKKSSDSPR